MFVTAKSRKTSAPRPVIGPIIASGLSSGLLLVSLTFAPTARAQQAPSGIDVTHAFVAGEILVKVKGKSGSRRAQAFVGRAVTDKSMVLKGSWSGMNLHHFALAPQQDVTAAINGLLADPDVEYAEPNYIVVKQSTGPDGPPMSTEQMQSVVTAAGSAGGQVGAFSSPYVQSNAPINVPQAWAQMTPGKLPPIVAVIDTGLDLSNTVFTNSGALWTNAGEIPGNGVDDDHNGFVDDVHGWNFAYGNNTPQDDDGHGTHVSGIILGISQNIAASPIGAAQIRIMPLKFLDSSGSGSTSDAVNAIYYAVNNGAQIMNNSWGGGGFSSALLDAISYSYSRHCLFVAAAGNSGSNNDAAPSYPASYNVPALIAVAATDDSDGFASFSNFGAFSVNLGGPGVSILSTLPNNTWGYESGTSMATPMITGVAAVMLREKPGMYGYQVKNTLFAGNQSIASLVNRTSTQGRVNALNSIVAAKSASISFSQPAYDPTSIERSRAAASGAGASMGGCGSLAAKMRDGAGDGDDGLNGWATVVLAALLLAPVVVSLTLRARSTGRDQRKHERFRIASQVTMRMGDRELTGSVSSISLGGAQVDADALLQNGGLITMRISSPDGTDQIEVKGKVVWSEENKRYGVAFSEAGDGALDSIKRWTAGLSRH